MGLWCMGGGAPAVLKPGPVKQTTAVAPCAQHDVCHGAPLRLRRTPGATRPCACRKRVV